MEGVLGCCCGRHLRFRYGVNILCSLFLFFFFFRSIYLHLDRIIVILSHGSHWKLFTPRGAATALLRRCQNSAWQKTDIADRFVIIVAFPLSDRPVLLCYKPLKQPTNHLCSPTIITSSECLTGCVVAILRIDSALILFCCWWRLELWIWRVWRRRGRIRWVACGWVRRCATIGRVWGTSSRWGIWLRSCKLLSFWSLFL